MLRQYFSSNSSSVNIRGFESEYASWLSRTVAKLWKQKFQEEKQFIQFWFIRDFFQILKTFKISFFIFPGTIWSISPAWILYFSKEVFVLVSNLVGQLPNSTHAIMTLISAKSKTNSPVGEIVQGYL